MTDFTKILDKAKELESKMKESQEKIKNIQVEGTSGSNSIKITLNGENEMIKINLSDEVMKEDKVIIEDLIAPAALGIVIKNPLPLAKLKIKAPLATKVEIATKAVNGPIDIAISIDASGTFSAPALATVQGDVAITCGSANLNNLTVIQGNCAVTANTISAKKITSITGNLSISSDGVSMPTLETVGGNVTVTGTNSETTADIVDFANLSNVGGETEIEADDVNLNTGQPHNSGGNG